MPFRKKREDVDLSKILDRYNTSAAPAPPPPSAVGTIHCVSCKRPNIYDMRHTPPRRCVWCRTPLR
jgi:hypothetical protein